MSTIQLSQSEWSERFAPVAAEIRGLRGNMMQHFEREVNRRLKRRARRGAPAVYGKAWRVSPRNWVGEKNHHVHTLSYAGEAKLMDVLTQNADGTLSFVAPYDYFGRFRSAKASAKTALYTKRAGSPFVQYTTIRTVFGRVETNRYRTTQTITLGTPTYKDIGEFKQRDNRNRINPIGHSGIECLNTNLGTDRVGHKRKNWTFFTVEDLRMRAKWNNIRGGHKMSKNELIASFMKL